MRALTFSSVCILVLALAHVPQAQAGDRVKAKEKAAKKACAAGDFRKGVDILAGLYVDTDDVTYIFNQGRCYEQNHQWVDATDRFREYVRKDQSLSSDVRADVERHIADCEAMLEKQGIKATPAPVAPTVVTLPPPPPDPPPVSPQEEKVVSVARPPRHEDRGSRLRVTGLVLGSIGAAALASGLVLNLKANSLARDFNKTRNPTTQSTQSSYKTGSMIGYGVGAGALVTGVLLYIIGWPSNDTDSSAVSLLPVWMPDEFTLSLGRTF